MSVIEVKDLHREYKENGISVHAVNGVNLTIEAGEFTAIVGPSGSGKTTLLNMLGGLDKPSSGSVTVEGYDLASLTPGKLTDFRLHHIGFVFQAYNLIPVLSARENVEFILQLQGVSGKERESRARELLRDVGLVEQAQRRPHELSGGQQQRVAVARALAALPAFVLADEPTANLDSASAEALLDLMERLGKERKMTFLFSTHDPRVVARAHRVITLRDGKIVSDEHPKGSCDAA